MNQNLVQQCVYENFLKYADRKKEIVDEDIHEIVETSNISIQIMIITVRDIPNTAHAKKET